MSISGSAILQDPSSGNGAAVDEDGRLEVNPKTDWQVAMENGDCYAFTNVAADIAQNETVLHVQNNSTTRNFHVVKVTASNDEAGIAFAVHLPAACTPSGTSLSGVNLNRTKNKTAPTTATADETNNAKANIIALTHVAADTPLDILGDGVNDICILGEDDAIAVDVLTATPAETQCIILGYMKDAA